MDSRAGSSTDQATEGLVASATALRPAPAARKKQGRHGELELRMRSREGTEEKGYERTWEVSDCGVGGAFSACSKK